MPKQRKMVKKEHGIVFVKESSKFRVGGRKSHRNLHLLSTAEIVKMVGDSNYSKHQMKIKRVLFLRGVDINGEKND